MQKWRDSLLVWRSSISHCRSSMLSASSSYNAWRYCVWRETSLLYSNKEELNWTVHVLLCVDGWVQVQIATLMQLQGSRADPAQLERLQSMLSEKNGEIQNLMTKLQRLEKMEVRTHFIRGNWKMKSIQIRWMMYRKQIKLVCFFV